MMRQNAGAANLFPINCIRHIFYVIIRSARLNMRKPRIFIVK